MGRGHRFSLEYRDIAKQSVVKALSNSRLPIHRDPSFNEILVKEVRRTTNQRRRAFHMLTRLRQTSHERSASRRFHDQHPFSLRT